MENSATDNANVPGPSRCMPIDDYEASQLQQEEIEKSIRESGPLVGDVEPISVLADDFADHPIYLEKLEQIKKKYSKIRRLRRDGNCFYRGFGFAYLEHLIKNNNPDDYKKFLDHCRECKDELIKRGYTEFTVEDFYDQFTSLVMSLEEDKDNNALSLLKEKFTDQGYADYFVVFLSYMQQNEDFFVNFIDDNRSVKRFCEMDVEPMGLESDNIHISALSCALDVPISIENCQQSGDLNTINFTGKDDSNSAVCKSPAPVTLLYRPGHYDILYS